MKITLRLIRADATVVELNRNKLPEIVQSRKYIDLHGQDSLYIAASKLEMK